MTWRKRDVDYELNPQILAAGRDAAHVYDVLLGINARWSCQGELRESRASLGAIVARLGVHKMSPRRVTAALIACVRESLINQENGLIRIVAWGPKWETRYRADGPTVPEPTEPTESELGGMAPMSSAERQRLWRERQRNGERNGVTASVTNRNGDRNATVTENVTDRNANRNGSVTPRARASGSGSGRIEENRRARSLSDARAQGDPPSHVDADAQPRASVPLLSPASAEAEPEQIRNGASMGGRNPSESGQKLDENSSQPAIDYARLLRACDNYSRAFPRKETP